MYRFVLRDLDGDDAGQFVTSHIPRGLGEVFPTGDGRRLRIVDMLNVPESERDGLRVAGVWRVEPAER